MQGTSALISGASIAGPALAFWLAKYGASVTVVEQAPALLAGELARAGGDAAAGFPRLRSPVPAMDRAHPAVRPGQREDHDPQTRFGIRFRRKAMRLQELLPDVNVVLRGQVRLSDSLTRPTTPNSKHDPRRRPSVTVERINPPELASPVRDVYSQIAVGRGSAVVAIAGQVALDPDGHLVGPGDHGAQAEQAFRNLRLALEAIGWGPADLLKNTIHVVGHRPELVEPIFAAGRRVFGGDWPRSASTLLAHLHPGGPRDRQTGLLERATD